jgi:hypothetical protein
MDCIDSDTEDLGLDAMDHGREDAFQRAKYIIYTESISGFDPHLLDIPYQRLEQVSFELREWYIHNYLKGYSNGRKYVHKHYQRYQKVLTEIHRWSSQRQALQKIDQIMSHRYANLYEPLILKTICDLLQTPCLKRIRN